MKAERGQTVLLSPASASFDEFVGYEERGDKFAEIVKSLGATVAEFNSENAAEQTVATTQPNSVEQPVIPPESERENGETE